MSDTVAAPPPARSRKRLVIGGSVAVLVVLAGLAIFKPFAPKLETITVSRQTLKEEVEVSGSVEARLAVVLKSEVAGTVEALAAVEGGLVKAGDPLIALDARNAYLQLVQAQRQAAAQYDQAQTELTNAEKALREATVRQNARLMSAEANVNKAKSRAQQVQIETERLDSLLDENLVSRQTVEQMRDALTQARLDLRNAEISWEQAKNEKSEVVAAQSRVKAAQTSLASAKSQGEVAVALAQKNVEKFRIRAPFTGTLTDWKVEVGDVVTPGTPLGEFKNLNEVVLRLLVDETDLPKMQTGGPVRITFDAYPNETFDGQILTVSRAGQLNNTVMVFPVDVRFDSKWANILPGMSGDATILVREIPSALAIPWSAVKRDGTKYKVTVLRNNKPEEIEIETGAVTLDQIEVTKGLEEGDQVVVPSAPKGK